MDACYWFGVLGTMLNWLWYPVWQMLLSGWIANVVACYWFGVLGTMLNWLWCPVWQMLLSSLGTDGLHVVVGRLGRSLRAMVS